jgi:hypothetical protein
MEQPKNISVEITDANEFHCFRLVLNPRSQLGGREASLIRTGGERIEVMLHARALVDLIHECSAALCQWQAETTSALIQRLTGLSEEEARQAGLIAPGRT